MSGKCTITLIYFNINNNGSETTTNVNNRRNQIKGIHFAVTSPSPHSRLAERHNMPLFQTICVRKFIIGNYGHNELYSVDVSMLTLFAYAHVCTQ